MPPLHASGILICDRPVDDYVPLAVGADNAVVAELYNDNS